MAQLSTGLDYQQVSGLNPDYSLYLILNYLFSCFIKAQLAVMFITARVEQSTRKSQLKHGWCTGSVGKRCMLAIG